MTAIAVERKPKAKARAIGSHLDTKVRDLPVADLIVDPRVNPRPLNFGWLAAEEKRFDAGGIGILHVSQRPDGTLSVIDGQQRVELCRRIGYGDQLVECRVYYGLTIAQEANLFRQLNNNRKVGRLHDFMAALTAGDRKYVAINSIVQSVGLSIHGQAGKGHINCVGVLVKLYDGDVKVAKKPDPRCILHSLECAVGAWGPESTSFRGPVVHGLGLCFLRDGDRIKAADMTVKLSLIPGGAAGLEAKATNAKDIHNRSLPFSTAGVITDIYNKGLGEKNRLQRWWSA